MLSPTKSSVMASLLAVTSYAQSSNSDVQSLTCDDLSGSLAHNASVVLNTTAINLSYLGSGESVRVYEDDRFTWQMSSLIGPGYAHGREYGENETQAVLWLDTGDSDMERLGDIMGLCHSYIPLHNSTTGNLTWSREVLERAQDDNGDCMLSGAIAFDNLPLNMSAQDRIWPWDQIVNMTSYPDDVELPTCGDRNLSSGWGNRLYETIDYDVALNFPLVDIMTFYPTIPVTEGQSTFTTHVKLVCLKPGNVQDGSRAPRSAKEVLDEYYDSQDEQDADDDESGAERAFGWAGKATLAATIGTVVGVWLGL